MNPATFVSAFLFPIGSGKRAIQQQGRSLTKLGRHANNHSRLVCVANIPVLRMVANGPDTKISRQALIRSLALVSLGFLSSKPKIQAQAAQLESEFRVIPIQPGTGQHPIKPTSSVSIKYVIRRRNGYFVDASYGFDRFENYNFAMGRNAVIKGLEMALLGQTENAKFRVVIPPELGYVQGVNTNKNTPGPIPPEWGSRRSLYTHSKQDLVFEIQVVRVQDK